MWYAILTFYGFYHVEFHLTVTSTRTLLSCTQHRQRDPGIPDIFFPLPALNDLTHRGGGWVVEASKISHVICATRLNVNIS